MANQNITLSLPEEDLREARILAAQRYVGVAASRPRTQETVERETGYDAAKERSLALLREGTDLGTGGIVRPRLPRRAAPDEGGIRRSFLAGCGQEAPRELNQRMHGVACRSCGSACSSRA